MKSIAKFLHPEIFDKADRLETHVETLRIELESMNEMVSRLRNENSVLADRNQRLIDENGQQTNKIEQLSTDYNEIVDKLNYLSTRYDEMEEKYHNLANMGVEDVRARYDQLMENESNAWSIFEVMGFDSNGVKINFNWNHKFIEEINKMGFTGESDEECVQQFFALMKMLPASFVDDPVNDVS